MRKRCTVGGRKLRHLYYLDQPENACPVSNGQIYRPRIAGKQIVRSDTRNSTVENQERFTSLSSTDCIPIPRYCASLAILSDLDSSRDADVDEMIPVLLGAEYEPVPVGQRRGRNRRNYATAVVYLLRLLSEGERRDRQHIRGHGGATRGGHLLVDSASDGHDFRGHLQFARERQNEQLHAVSRVD